jgi:hypothetical protein
MKIIPSDFTVETIVGKIKKNLWDLQPDFQRGEVWSLPKKQRLIDSILREWHIPPVHTIKVKESGKIEILDGQQRLTAIRDFCRNEFTISGTQLPLDSKISSLDGLLYNEIPEKERLDFDDFTIRVLTIEDYEPEEPGELFYRLNQLTSLTAAEQRNAFYGVARSQIKALSSKMHDLGFSAATVGFSNSRMAYDDVLARVATTLDRGTLNYKLTANNVTEKYRSKNGFKSTSINKLNSAVETLANILSSKPQYKIKLNKATLYSWLCIFSKFLEDNDNTKRLCDSFYYFETLKGAYKEKSAKGGFDIQYISENQKHLIAIYKDRSSSRVGDISSVILRDLITWLIIYENNQFCTNERLEAIRVSLKTDFDSRSNYETTLQKLAESNEWGVSL